MDEVFRRAADAGRRSLYEHEVYQILGLVGLEVPRFAVVRDPAEVTEALLRRFGREVVVKILSPQIAHKQHLGGVRIVRNHDPFFIQYVMHRMGEEVRARFPADAPPVLDGFLLVEFIPHTQALGYEVLIGSKEDPAFGPVITMSKGGDDAEFFARYYDPANLFLPPFDERQARSMVESLNIRHKFAQLGRLDYLEIYARALSLVSRLAHAYSSIAAERPAYILEELDVNPFVISKDDRLVAIDGFARFTPAAEARPASCPVNPDGLEAFFHPDGVAVAGVSADLDRYSLGREIALLLHDLGRRDLYLINPKGGRLALGGTVYPLYPGMADLPRAVDLVVYTAPAQYAVEFMRSLAGTRTKAVILISGLPAQIKYADFARDLAAAVPPGVRVIGPNCMGVFAAPEGGRPGLNTFFLEEKRLEIRYAARSNTALLTQSGALAVTAIDKHQNARIFRSGVSFGNKLDVKLTDLLAYFGREDEVKVIALYLEGLDPGEGRTFFELAREIRKPIIAYKAGRTEAGARAAASHTASMSGSYEVFRAACLQAGVILAENIEDHYHYMRVFAALAERLPAGNRVAGVVNAGFESTVGADELQGLRQAQLSPATVARLNAINRYGLVDTTSPFLDVTPMADDRFYAAFVEAILADDGVDCVFVAVVPHAATLKTLPENCRDEDGLAALLVELSGRYGKPMVVSVNAGRHYQDFVAVLEEGGLPVYTDIRAAIKSLDTFVSYHMGRMAGSVRADGAGVPGAHKLCVPGEDG